MKLKRSSEAVVSSATPTPHATSANRNRGRDPHAPRDPPCHGRRVPLCHLDLRDRLDLRGRLYLRGRLCRRDPRGPRPQRRRLSRSPTIGQRQLRIE